MVFGVNYTRLFNSANAVIHTHTETRIRTHARTQTSACITAKHFCNSLMHAHTHTGAIREVTPGSKVIRLEGISSQK